jgi:hypothetical protein
MYLHMSMSPTALLLVLLAVAPPGPKAYRTLKVERAGSSQVSVFSSGRSSTDTGSWASDDFIPFYGHAISRQSHGNAKRSSPVRSAPQYSKSDAPSGADEESETHAQADSDAMLASESSEEQAQANSYAMPPADSLRKQANADSYATPALESMFEGSSEEQGENSSMRALESMMKQNAYLAMIPEAEAEILQRDPYLAEVWAEVEKFANECEELIANLGYIRSAIDAFAQTYPRNAKGKTLWKMQQAKTQILLNEVQDSRKKTTGLSWRSTAVKRMVQKKLAPVKGGSGDQSQAMALISCLKAADAAWRDVAAAQARILTHLERMLGG